MKLKSKPSTGGIIGGSLSASPLHEQVRERVMNLILSGAWPEGHILPPETELARHLGVSYGTARQALQKLTKEGVLIRKPRIGTIVTGRAPHHTVDRFYNHYRLHNLQNELINTDTVTRSIEMLPASKFHAQCFRLPEPFDIVSLVRVRYHKKRPIMVDHMAIPHRFVPDFPRSVQDVPALLLNHLRDRYDLRISAVRETLRADIANKQDIELLELPAEAVPTPLLVIDDTCFDNKNQALLSASHRALSDDYRYVNEVQ